MRFFALCLLVAACLTPMAHAEEGGKFVERSVTLGRISHRYRVFLPAGWQPGRRWPVILFLHGVRERGDDGAAPTTAALGKALANTPADWPAVAVFPQCHTSSWWHDDPAMETLALTTMDRAIDEFRGDPDRVYLAGVSMGGYGVWAIGSRHASRFAAFVVVCGGLRIPDAFRESVRDVARKEAAIAERFRGKPVWLFHGVRDHTVPVAESRRMTAALKAAGAEVRFTEYPSLEHNAWDKAFSEKALAEWLFAQSRRP